VQSNVERLVKRGLDVVSASTALAVLAPLIAVAALAVRLDSRGPMFFRQERLGRGGRRFRVWKLRTMVHGASVVVDASGNVVNSSDDSRHTRVGKLLRRTSIDELPQLLNVLVGDMSLVGPRPDLPEALSMYSDRERLKLSVKPGITGLAQTNGRNGLSAHEKWALDATYAERASLALDLRILARTVLRVASREGVYAAGASPPAMSEREGPGGEHGRS